MEKESKTPRPEPPCGLPKTGNDRRCRSLADCLRCGWNPEEAKRRRALPLKRGEDGRYHKDISQSKIGDQPGGD